MQLVNELLSGKDMMNDILCIIFTIFVDVATNEQIYGEKGDLTYCILKTLIPTT